MQKKLRRDSRAAPSRCAVSPLNETAPHGRRELCTLSSAQPLVLVSSAAHTVKAVAIVHTCVMHRL